MKILWFITNLNYQEDNPYVGCGWITSLLDRLILHEGIEIGVAFFSERVNRLTVHDQGPYVQFVIPSYINKWEKIKRNLAFTDFLYTKRERTLLNVVDSFGPNVIHVFGSESPFGLIASKTSVPVVIHIQGILNPYIRKWFPTGFSNSLMFRYTPLLKSLKLSGYWADYLRQKRLARREEEIYRVTRYFCGRTDWDKRITTLLSPSANYYHCEEMLRPSFYEQQWKMPPQEEAIRLISVINPNTYKGIETILETADLLKKFSRRPIRWSVAGVHTNSPLVRIFSNRKSILPSSVQVEFLGPVQEAALINKMLDADLFVHASHIDNSPNSLCEAMALGMPIISTAVGGIQSLLTDQREGLLVQDGEPFGLAGAIIELSNDPSRGERLGAQARLRATKRHDPQHIISKQITIYKDIISRHGT